MRSSWTYEVIIWARTKRALLNDTFANYMMQIIFRYQTSNFSFECKETKVKQRRYKVVNAIVWIYIILKLQLFHWFPVTLF